MAPPSPSERRPATRIAVRVGIAFAIVLAFFVAALGVTDRILDEIGEAEDRVARFDTAKHAGHHVAAMAREMYIHQAHTVLLLDGSHLPRYRRWVGETEAATAHLRAIAPTDEDRARAAHITALTEQMHAVFEADILPALEPGDRARALAAHDRVNALRREVVQANRALSADFEARARTARVDAEALRARARLGILGCFGLAALAAVVLGAWLLRSVLSPVAQLRAGAERIAAGALDHRIAYDKADEFGALADAFDRMTQDLARHQAAALEAQRLRLLGEVTAGVAHELNNPLGVILGYLRLIEKDGRATPDRLATIGDEARQCQRIVADLLEAVRPGELAPTTTDLAALARDAAARARAANPDADVAAEIEEPLVTRCDPSRLRQVLDNVVHNAIDAGPPVRIAGARDADTVRLRVLDHGPGVTEDARGRIFDPFFTTKADGTGLGLALARALVEAHGGALDVVDAPEGACFEIVLPRESEAAP